MSRNRHIKKYPVKGCTEEITRFCSLRPIRCRRKGCAGTMRGFDTSDNTYFECDAPSCDMIVKYESRNEGRIWMAVDEYWEDKYDCRPGLAA